MVLAKDIKELRRLLKLKQRELAEIIGVSVGTIQNYESGGVIPPAKQKLLSGILSDARANMSHNSGNINTGIVGGHNISIHGADYKKIIEKNRIELTRQVAEDDLCQQKINALEAEITMLKDIIKSKDEALASKNETIELLKRKQ